MTPPVQSMQPPATCKGFLRVVPRIFFHSTEGLLAIGKALENLRVQQFADETGLRTDVETGLGRGICAYIVVSKYWDTYWLHGASVGNFYSFRVLCY